MDRLSYSQIDDLVLTGLKPAFRPYWIVMALLAALVGYGVSVWVYQVRTGMGVSGYNHPVGWAFYIVNFVFWIGIGHAGTLISAILHLVRSKWRTAVSRSAEAMTVFAVLTAGLFPLIDLGRVWVFYYIVPYPSERQLWPNFVSPLAWDICAVSTYLTVSIIFFYVGLIPDLATARDRCETILGHDHPRSRLYRRLAVGWSGAGSQWWHYGRGYLFFAALATPLVISVHSVVSWDFAMSLLPGWHTTIFAPYFVAGAIHSGLAMVLTLLIPVRRLLHLEQLITVNHFESVAKTMIVTTAVVAYAYGLEPFMAWYSGDLYERQFAVWRASGWMAWVYWALFGLNVLAPLAFIFKRVRRSLVALFVIGILVNLGMWLERYLIVIASTAHDFMPHNWGPYAPTWVEPSITLGMFAFFSFWFLGFAKLFPAVAGSEIKALEAEEGGAGEEPAKDNDRPRRAVALQRRRTIRGKATAGVVGVFGRAEDLLAALEQVRTSRFAAIETFTPMKLDRIDRVLGHGASPVRYWTLIGALSGLTGGFALAIGSALVNGLITGGKHPVAIIPYCIVGFEGTILLGSLANLAGVMFHCRLGRSRLRFGYDPRFSRDKFGLVVACAPGEVDEAKGVLAATRPEELHVVE